MKSLRDYINLIEGTAAGIVPDGSILKANQLVWSPDSDNGKRFSGKDLEKLGDGRWCADGYCIFHKDYRAILDKIWFDKNSSPTTPAKAKTSAFEPGIDAKNTGSWDSKQIDYKGTVQAQAIQHANNIANVNSIVVGKTLDIPGVGTYKIAPGDTLDAIAAGRYKKPDNLQKSDSGIWNKGPDESDAEKQRNIRKNFNARDQSTRDQEERLHQIRRDDNWQNGPNQHEPESKRLGINEATDTREFMRNYIRLVEGAETPVDPNKLMASMLMGGEYKEFDLTSTMEKNNWVGSPKQVINQADKWLSDFLRQRGVMYSNLKITYKGATMNSSKIGDADAPDPDWVNDIKNSFKK